MNLKTISVTVLFSILLVINASAHFIWIETSSSGKIQQPQQVKIFYGEYSDNVREEVAVKFQEVKDFSTWLIAPDGEKIKLQPQADKNFYTVSFIPTQAGSYTIEVVNTDREVVNWTKYDLGIIKPNYYATATINVEGNAKETSLNALTSSLLNILISSGSVKLNQPVSLAAGFRNQHASKQKLMVFAPNGWSKEITTNEKGEAEFLPLWQGTYVIEAIYTEKTPGDFKGMDYQAIRHRATCAFEVKQ